jgi:TRAP-type C4-dicarboxylate transport system substrate-binding protein
MNKMIDDTKSLLNDTAEAAKRELYEYSVQQVKKQLAEGGLSVDDFSEEEFQQMVAEAYRKNESFGKGIAVGAGALMLLNLLG